MSLSAPWSTVTENGLDGQPVLLAQAVQENFDRLFSRFTDTGGATLAIRAGSATVSGTADSAPIPHGLGRNPVAIVATPADLGGGVVDSDLAVHSYDETSFVIHNFGPANGFFWIAIG